MDYRYLCRRYASLEVKQQKPTGKRQDFESCLIVCNGKISKRLLSEFFKPKKTGNKFYIIAADGAANTLHKYKLAPHVIIGDLDSVKPKILKHYKSKKAVIRKVTDQNLNDFEKALQFALTNKYKNIYVIGATGKRLDHTLNNLSVLKRNYKKANIRLIDTHFEIFFAGKKTEFDYPKGETVSLLALPKATGVNTGGLKFPLNNEPLEFGGRQGTLNSSTEKTVSIEFGKGDLLVFKRHFGKIK